MTALDPHLSELIADLFGLPAHEITPQTGRATLAQWDSLLHLRLILAVEKGFQVRFPTAKIAELTSAGAIQEALDAIRTST